MEFHHFEMKDKDYINSFFENIIISSVTVPLIPCSSGSTHTAPCGQ